MLWMVLCIVYCMLFVMFYVISCVPGVLCHVSCVICFVFIWCYILLCVMSCVWCVVCHVMLSCYVWCAMCFVHCVVCAMCCLVWFVWCMFTPCVDLLTLLHTAPWDDILLNHYMNINHQNHWIKTLSLLHARICSCLKFDLVNWVQAFLPPPCRVNTA